MTDEILEAQGFPDGWYFVCPYCDNINHFDHNPIGYEYKCDYCGERVGVV